MHQSTRFVFAVVAATLGLLLPAPNALAFQTRTPLGSFGPDGAGTCTGFALATGTADLAAATGTGDTSTLATGSGTLAFSATGEGSTTAGSATITNLNTTSGAFAVGESISGRFVFSIPDGTTITAVGPSTLTLSQAATLTRSNIEIVSGSKTITNLTTNTGAFAVGASISAEGIPPGTTITATGPASLTLSAGVTQQGSQTLVSGSKTITNLTTTTGAFTVGWRISGNGIPPGTTITALDLGSLTLSAGVTQSGAGVSLTAGSLQLTNLATNCGTFAVGQSLEAVGISKNTTITAVGPDTLTLSSAPTSPDTGVQLTASSTFDAAEPLAFDQSNHRLYVFDSGSVPGSPATIHAFAAPAQTPFGGAFPLSAPPSAVGPSLAVDNAADGSAGNIFYGSSAAHQVFGFDSAGAALGGNFPIPFLNPKDPCGVAVDSGGNIWIADRGNTTLKIFKYDSAGNSLDSLSTAAQGQPCQLAFDSNDDLYVAFASKRAVWKYTASSGYKTATQITPVGFVPPGYSITGLAVDRASHRLYVAVSTGSLTAFDSSGSQLYTFGFAGASAEGITIDESTDRVYVSGSDRVIVYGALADFPDATATPCPATNIATTSADLCATIDDNSALPTRWFFQVSKDNGATWAKVCPDGAGGLTAGGQSGLPVSCTANSLQSGTDYLFRVITNKGGGSTDVASSTLGFTTVALPPASATCGPATNVTTTTADLSCTIDDNNAYPTNWRFQVSKDGTTWVDTKVSGVTKGNESGVVASGTVKDLDPNTAYHFRLATSKGPGAADTDFEGPAPFNTLLAPPLVSSVGSYGVTDTSAYLAGEVDPRNDATSYVFEYGTSPGSLDSSTPQVDIGSDGNVIVSQPISNLAPDSDYYFKLVTTNGAGPTESATISLHTRATPLPTSDVRAYEQVSPPDKNFANANNIPLASIASDGGAVAFYMFTGLGNPPGQIGLVSTSYISRRGPEGWRTRWPGEPLCGPPPDTGGNLTLSPNLDRAVITHSDSGSCPIPPLDPAAPFTDNLYLADYTTEPPTYQLLTPQPGNHTATDYFVAASEDFTHVIYRSTGLQTADAPVGEFQKLFDWHDGALNLVSRDTANVPFTTASAVPESAVNSVSATGDRIFFQNPTPGGGCGNNPTCELYMRQNDTTTYDVSQSECTTSCGPDAPAVFQWATPAGNKALFTTAAKLTDDDNLSTAGGCTGITPIGCDLYLYTHSAHPATNQNLTLLSKDLEPADGTHADVRGVLGISNDGDTVYFVALGQIVSGAPIGPGEKVYRWRRNGGSPTVDYLAPQAGDWVASSSAGTRPPTRLVTPDGAYLLLQTPSRLDPGADHDSDTDVYRWDQAAGWRCLSCQFPGLPSAGDSTFQLKTVAWGQLQTLISDDGQRVFFQSSDALLPADTNGESGCPSTGPANNPTLRCQDVYEWHDGALSLISTGLGSYAAQLLGASHSGGDVFFSTDQRLVGWDVDGNVDIYDARIGGGFPEPPPSGAPCEGEACRGAPTSAPPASPAGTAAFEGGGNPSPSPACDKGRVSRHGRCVSKKHRHSKHKRHQRADRNRRIAR